jgi:hypothetical protein
MSPLVGRWRLVRTEAQGPSQSIILDFSPDGALTYSIRLPDRTQILNLTYEVDGDIILSDQPSAPRKESTRFSIDSEGVLELEKSGERSWYEQA